MHPPLVLVCSKRRTLYHLSRQEAPTKRKRSILWSVKTAQIQLDSKNVLHGSVTANRRVCIKTRIYVKTCIGAAVEGPYTAPCRPEKGSRQPRSCAHFLVALHSRSRSAEDSTLALPACDSGVLSVPAGLRPLFLVPAQQKVINQQCGKERKGLSSLP